LLVGKLSDFDDPPSAVAKPPFGAHSSDDFVRPDQLLRGDRHQQDEYEKQPLALLPVRNCRENR
jgi:hypothetical protein